MARLYPKQGAGSVHIERYVCGRARSNAYVAHDPAGQALLIDAGAGAAEQIIPYVEGEGLVPVAIVITHGHPDHIWNARRVAERYDVPTYIHRDDLSWFTDPVSGQHVPFVRGYGRAFGRYHKVRPRLLHVVEDGQRIDTGPYQVDVIHTPGHSKGSSCLRVGDDVFSGDTVFKGNVGRIFLGGDAGSLRRSVETKLLPLPDDVRLYPGHGPRTVVGDERAFWERYLEGDH